MQSDSTLRADGTARTAQRPLAAANLRPLWLLPVLLGMGPGLTDADTQNSPFAVSVYVNPKTIVSAAALPNSIVVTAADLAAGYKDVSVNYRVTHNTAHGYMLQFAERAGITRAIDVRGLGAPIRFGAFGADVPQFGGPRRDGELTLQYRLHLAMNVPPGVYPLPVFLSATPL